MSDTAEEKKLAFQERAERLRVKNDARKADMRVEAEIRKRELRASKGIFDQSTGMGRGLVFGIFLILGLVISPFIFVKLISAAAVATGIAILFWWFFFRFFWLPLAIMGFWVIRKAARGPSSVASFAFVCGIAIGSLTMFAMVRSVYEAIAATEVAAQTQSDADRAAQREALEAMIFDAIRSRGN